MLYILICVCMIIILQHTLGKNVTISILYCFTVWKKIFLIHFELTFPQIWFKLVTFFNIGEVGKGNIICWKKIFGYV